MSCARSFLHRIGSTPDGAEDRDVTAAATDQSVKAASNLLVRWRRVLLEQGLGPEHPTIQAVATLECLLVDERLLNRMRMRRSTQTLQRHDLFAQGTGHGQRT